MDINLDSNSMLLIAIISVFVSIILLVIGFVPTEIDEDEIYGYRIIKRNKMLEENLLFRITLPLVKVFAHYIKMIPDNTSMPLLEKIGPLRQTLRVKLMRGGFFGSYTPNEFLGMCCVASFSAFAMTLILTFQLTGTPQVVLAVLMMPLATVLPFFQLDGKIAERLVEIDRQLPYTVDLLVLSMRAGLDFLTALDRVVTRGMQQNPHDPMIQEFGVVLQEMRVGTSRTDALLNLCERVQSDYLNSMVGAIVQSEKRGSPLANVLDVQVGTIREKRTQKIEKKANEAAVKILMPLMFIFGSVFVIVIGAMILHMMTNT